MIDCFASWFIQGEHCQIGGGGGAAESVARSRKAVATNRTLFEARSRSFLKIGTHKWKNNHKSVTQKAQKSSKKLQNTLWPPTNVLCVRCRMGESVF
jgi:shikimate 5-dehydrogenase